MFNNKKIKKSAVIMGIMLLLLSCAQNEISDYDNGSYGTASWDYKEQVTRTPVSISLRSAGVGEKEVASIQNTEMYIDKETGMPTINVKFLREYQNNVKSYEMSINGPVLTKIAESDTLVDMIMKVQGEDKYIDNPNGDPTGIEYDKGWVEKNDETGKVEYVFITTSDLSKLEIMAYEAVGANPDLNRKVRITAVPDTANGMKEIKGAEYPRIPADTGKVGEPFVPDMNEWRLAIPETELTLYEGKLNPATGKHEHDLTKPLTGKVYVDRGSKNKYPANGDKMMIVLADGRCTLVDIPEKTGEYEIDILPYLPEFTDGSDRPISSNDDYGKLPSQNYTDPEKVLMYGNYLIAKLNVLDPKDMNLINIHNKAVDNEHGTRIQQIRGNKSKFKYRIIKTTNGDNIMKEGKLKSFHTLYGELPSDIYESGRNFDVWATTQDVEIYNSEIHSIPTRKGSNFDKVFHFNIDPKNEDLLKNEIKNATGAVVFGDTIETSNGVQIIEVMSEVPEILPPDPEPEPEPIIPPEDDIIITQ